MPSQIDRMTEAFVQLRNDGPSIDVEKWTETDARSKFIDTVLIGCLGWTEHDIRRELSKDGKRLDYSLMVVAPLVIVEAKRPGVPLHAARTPGVARLKIKTLLKANTALREHFTQVVQYCRDWSAPFAVLTNGRSYYVFAGVRTDGVPWEDGSCLALSDIFDPEFNFADLYNLLSKHSVRAGRLRAAILGELPEPPATSLRTGFASPDAVVGKNPLGLAMEPMLRHVFSDITKDDSPDVLENCYVPPGESRIRDEEFEALLLDRPPDYLASTSVTIGTRNAAKRFQDSIKEYLSRQEWSQTVLVVGGVGVGKTMFLRRFFELPLEHDLFIERTLALFVDFRKPGLSPAGIPELVYERLREVIEEMDGRDVAGDKAVKYDFSSEAGLTAVFWKQIQQFSRAQARLKQIDEVAYEKEKLRLLETLRRDSRAFVRGAFRVLRERYHRHVCVVLDNADQCDPEYQSALYVYSRTLEEDLACLIILALREEWYWRFGKAGGPLSAYHDIVFHIPAPRSRDVLAKRLDYAIELTSKYQIPPTVVTLASNIALDANHLAMYLRACKGAFFDDEEITTFFECMSNGSVRKGLDAFMEFLRSGHTKVNEYLMAIVGGATYKLQFHQVYKSIAFGQYAHYASRRSIVPNVFAPVTAGDGNGLSHFGRLYCLQYLTRFARIQMPVGEGFVGIADLRRFGDRLGMSEGGLEAMLQQMVAADLVEPDVRLKESPSEWAALRATAFGVYVLKRLVGKFAYLESVMIDTALPSSSAKGFIEAAYRDGIKPSLGLRVEAVGKFLEILYDLEVAEQRRVQAAGLSEECPPLMTMIDAVAKPDLERLQAMIDKPGSVLPY